MDISIDIETYSSVGIENGVYAYVNSADFEILLIAYKFDNSAEAKIIDLTETPIELIPCEHPGFIEALKSSEYSKRAYNANFERTCLAKVFGAMPPEQWHCTMVHAAMLGLPRSLEDVGAAIGLREDERKMKVGKQLIRYFCVPCKPTKANGNRTRNYPAHDPEKWELFKMYCLQDVYTEDAIYQRIKKYPVPATEHKLWCFDQRSNDRGIRLDVPFVKGVSEYDDIRTEELIDEAARISGLENPNSLAQLKSYLAEEGLAVESITKDTLPELIEQAKAMNKMKALRMLEIRQALGKSSTKKYKAMLASVCDDGRLRGVLQFYGANRTGRWAGRIVQVHNLPQNKFEDIDLARQLVAEKDFEMSNMLFGESAFVFSQLIRTAFIASEGCRFIVSDFSAIEARVIAWLAGEQWRMKVFKEGGDIYCASASQMFHVPVVKHGENGHLRQKGKIAELALGYGGGIGAIKSMDKSGSIPEEELQPLVDNWRAANPMITRLWRVCELAAKTAIKERRAVKIQRGIIFSYSDGNLFVWLPSGRFICYWSAKIGENKFGSESITYGGTNQESGKWGRQETYGGKLVENIVQAIARDCLAESMTKVESAGYNIVMHVHDEMIVDVPDADTEAPRIIDEIMRTTPTWAEGLILKGEGYETKYYKKD